MAIDIFEELKKDKESIQVGDNQISTISFLANEQMKLEDEIKYLEEQLKAKKSTLEELATKTLPDALTEAGVHGFTLANGMDGTVKSFVSARISKSNEEEAFRWLVENEHGGIIKTIVSVDAGKDLDLASQATKALEDCGLDVSQYRNGHSQTLKKFVREQVEAGVSIPLDLFGAYIGQKTTIERK